MVRTNLTVIPCLAFSCRQSLIHSLVQFVIITANRSQHFRCLLEMFHRQVTTVGAGVSHQFLFIELLADFQSFLGAQA